MVRFTLFRRRNVWLPTIWGSLLLLMIGLAVCDFIVHNIYSFLAPNAPVGARVLVVEGWLPTAELGQAVQTFKLGGYERIVTTGGPIMEWPGLSRGGTYANIAAAYLIDHGIPSNAIVAVPTLASAQERTFLSAVVLRESAHNLGLTLDKIDVFSSGAHARRSRLLFQIALGTKVRVGVMAAQPSGYDPQAWWRSSSGVEAIAFQSIGLIWVKCCFWPGPHDSKQELWGE